MRDSEKKGIIILIVVGIVIIVALNILGINNEKETLLAQGEENTQGNNVELNTLASDSNNIKNPEENKDNNENTINKEKTNEFMISSDGKVLDTKTIEGMEISGIDLNYKNGLTDIVGNVTNKTQEEQGGIILDVGLINANGKIITKLPAYIPVLKPGESTKLKTSDIQDLTKATKIQITRQLLN